MFEVSSILDSEKPDACEGKASIPLKELGVAPEIKEPDDAIESEVSMEGLHERLAELKEVHPEKLYTHVIFPGGKDISHEEAYLFERSIVSQYDYYYSN